MKIDKNNKTTTNKERDTIVLLHQRPCNESTEGQREMRNFLPNPCNLFFNVQFLKKNIWEDQNDILAFDAKFKVKTEVKTTITQ